MNDTALNATDRCDGCGARAYVRVTVNGTDLLFCAHHARKYRDRLFEAATSWHDETSLLEQQEKARVGL